MDSSTLWSYVGMLLSVEGDSRGLTAADLAACTGIDLPLIERALNGEPVDITVVRTTAVALGWAWSDLLRRLAALPSPRGGVAGPALDRGAQAHPERPTQGLHRTGRPAHLATRDGAPVTGPEPMIVRELSTTAPMSVGLSGRLSGAL